jgi:nitronate monooxygenase
MTPGLALFYGGMVRAKSVLNMMMMSFGALGLISVLWVLYGYSLSFGNDVWGGLVGNLDFVGLKGLISAAPLGGADPSQTRALAHRRFPRVPLACGHNKTGKGTTVALPPLLRDSLRLPVIGAPMFIVSGPELVLAQCKAGIVGSFPALNARPQEVLDGWLTRIERELAAYKAENPNAKVAPFAVNQIVHTSNVRLQKDLDVCVQHRVPIMITSLRAPDAVVEAAHSYGGLVFHDVTTIKHARRALEAGVDGLILVATGAGGHAGRLSPFAFVPEVRQFYDGCVILSGAIASGGAILAAQALGADLAYIGTRFIASEEANAPADYKQMIIDSRAEDIVYTSLFTGVHGNYLKGSIVNAGLDPENLPKSDKSKMDFGGGSAKAKAWRDIWGAGQGVGQVVAAPAVGEIVNQLRDEYSASCAFARAES